MLSIELVYVKDIKEYLKMLKPLKDDIKWINENEVNVRVGRRHHIVLRTFTGNKQGRFN